MKLLWVILLALPFNAMAMNREAPLAIERGANSVRALEKENEIQRDLLGRKVVIDGNIDPGSVSVEAAPGSTVIIKANQIDTGTQRTTAPFYRNVEIPKRK